MPICRELLVLSISEMSWKLDPELDPEHTFGLVEAARSHRSTTASGAAAGIDSSSSVTK